MLVYPFLGDCLLCVSCELVQSQSVEDSRFCCSVSNGSISSVSFYTHTQRVGRLSCFRLLFNAEKISSCLPVFWALSRSRRCGQAFFGQSLFHVLILIISSCAWQIYFFEADCEGLGNKLRTQFMSRFFFNQPCRAVRVALRLPKWCLVTISSLKHIALVCSCWSNLSRRNMEYYCTLFLAPASSFMKWVDVIYHDTLDGHSQEVAICSRAWWAALSDVQIPGLMISNNASS